MSTVRPDRGDEVPAARVARARYNRILRFAGWNLAVTWFFELALPRIGLVKIAERTRTRRMQKFARKFHVLAVDLGGLMIKVGQFMSSRLDVLPPEITKELEGLQDEVPPVPFELIRRLAEAELGVPLAQAFIWVDETPVAAASLGQAHRARLAPQDAADTGLEAVVLKVQRPGIDEIVRVDLAALRKVGGWLSHVRLVYSRVDAPALVEEFAATSLEEIDYLHEARSSVQFAEIFADDPRVEVPEVVWERSTRRVLTLEDVTAIKITDHEGLLAAGIDPAEVAPVFAAVMFDQLFSTGFFHADPHPGNIFVTPRALPGAGGAGAGAGLRAGAGGSGASGDATDAAVAHPFTLTFIDFGMMGMVPPSTRAGLRKMLIAAASRDGKGLVDAARNLGVLLPSADTSELERAMTQLFARFGGMGFAELREVDPREFREFAVQFGDVVRALPFQLPENFLLIIRAMSLTSGVASALDPAFNLWDSVEPYAQRLIREERGNVVQDVAKQAAESARVALRLPGRLDSLATQFEEGTLSVQSPAIEKRVARLERSVGRVVSAIVFAALLVAGTVLRIDDTVFGTVLMVASVLPLLHALFSGRRGR
ncbi:AarF/UbiB family protein [Herbiconiux sp. CPCC 205716]|uniref:AarF/UbiB family protein n=1 Tax=Herbiconiux gentiana TaxID=2970912 RepID=A0ABT2GBA4_9MICO|nr:AarF/UbiB family protein [Herbiconiux gentiana]MCS5713484.1 AarF/UbiB family protein [Herbiconiux gentiana]